MSERCLIANDVSFNRYAHVRKDALISASGAMKAKFANAANAIMMTDKDDSPFGLNVVFSILHHKYHELGIRPTIPELYGLVCT